MKDSPAENMKSSVFWSPSTAWYTTQFCIRSVWIRANGTIVDLKPIKTPIHCVYRSVRPLCRQLFPQNLWCFIGLSATWSILCWSSSLMFHASPINLAFRLGKTIRVLDLLSERRTWHMALPQALELLTITSYVHAAICQRVNKEQINYLFSMANFQYYNSHPCNRAYYTHLTGIRVKYLFTKSDST